MEFINRGGPVKIRIGGVRDCHWATIKKGETVDLPARSGISYGFSVKTTEGKIGNKKVETKQISVPQKPVQKDFFKELCSINGVGRKTAEDIIRIFPKREDLKNTIQKMEKLPFRDDIEKLLMERYGKK